MPNASEGSLKNSYLYQGAFSELDADIGWTDFELRNYDAQIGRWMQMDPYDQYASGYLSMGDDPVSGVDPDGGYSWPPPGMEGLIRIASKSSDAVSTVVKVTSQLSTFLKIERFFSIVTNIVKIGSHINGVLETVAAGEGARTDRRLDEAEKGDWKGFYKSDLDTYARSLGYTNPSDLDLGNLMEQIFYDWFSRQAPARFNFRRNWKKIDDSENTIPDMVADDAYYPTVIVGRGIFRREMRAGPDMIVSASNIFEAKASKKGIYLSSNAYQVEYHIFNLAERLKDDIARGFIPTVSLVTTYDVTWSESISSYALWHRIDYYHYRAQFRIVNGKYQFNFGRHNKAEGSKNFK